MIDHDGQELKTALGRQGEDRGQVEVIIGIGMRAEEIGHMDHGELPLR